MKGPRTSAGVVSIKGQAELDKMRHAGRVHARIMQRLREMIEPGVSTLDLDMVAEQMTRDADCVPSFKGYEAHARTPYPATICAEVNEIVVHGIPSDDERLKPGDIIGVDLGVAFEGYHADGAFTVGVGEVDEESQRLMAVTQRSLELALEQVKPGATLRDLATAVQEYVEGEGFSVVTALCGHGIGAALHEPPQVPNYVQDGDPDSELVLEPGMTLAIEPMVNAGGAEVRSGADGWVVVTADGSRSAHFEHTVAVTEDGHRIMTAP